MSNSTNSSLPAISNTTLVGFVANPNGRGTLSLLWTCLFTIFTSTWSVLHLNAPAYGEKQWKVGLRKFRWMMVTVLFPEVIFALAVVDLRRALVILDCVDQAVNIAREGSLKCTIRTARQSTGKITIWKCRLPWYVQWLRWLVWLDTPLTKKPTTAIRCGQDKPPEQELTRQESYRLQGGNLDGTANVHELSDFHELGIEATSDSGRVTSTSLRNAENTCATSDSVSPSDEVQPFSGFEDRHQDMLVESLDWTLTHCYMVGMGGFVVPTPTRAEENGTLITTGNYRVLTAPSLLIDILTEHRDPIIAGFPLAEEEIRSLSKTNWFLKTIAIAQVLWVVLSVIGRASSHLPVTQLEVATISLAVFAIATYLLNWFKPQDLDGPVRSVSAETADWLLNNTATHTRLQILLPLTWTNLGDLDDVDWRKADGLRRIKTYGDTTSGTLIIVASSILFGGLHCLAWNFEFPTGAEKLAWRVSSLCYTMIPTVGLMIGAFLELLDGSNIEDWRACPLWSTLRRLAKFPEMYWYNVLLYPNAQRTSKTAHENLSFFDSGTEIDKQCPECAFRVQKLQARFEALTIHEASDLREILVDVRELLSLARNARPRSWNGNSYRVFNERLVKVNEHARTKPGVFALWKQWEVDLRSQLAEHSTSDAVLPRLAESSLDVVLQATEHWSLKVDGESEGCTWLNQVWLAVALLGAICSVAAVSSRIVIVVILFTSLRQVPLGVYDGLAWPAWLPHFS